MGAVDFNGVQLNSSFGRNFGLLYGYIQGNGNTADASLTVQSDKFNSARASFEDTRSESIPLQFKNLITNNNVGKIIDLSV